MEKRFEYPYAVVYILKVKGSMLTIKRKMGAVIVQTKIDMAALHKEQGWLDMLRGEVVDKEAARKLIDMLLSLSVNYTDSSSELERHVMDGEMTRNYKELREAYSDGGCSCACCSCKSKEDCDGCELNFNTEW